MKTVLASLRIMMSHPGIAAKCWRACSSRDLAGEDPLVHVMGDANDTSKPGNFGLEPGMLHHSTFLHAIVAKAYIDYQCIDYPPASCLGGMVWSESLVGHCPVQHLARCVFYVVPHPSIVSMAFLQQVTA